MRKKKKLEVDSDKSCTSNSDIHSESDIEQWLEEDNEEIAQIIDVTEFNESEIRLLIIFLLSKFKAKMKNCKMKLKDFIVVLCIEFSKI